MLKKQHWILPKIEGIKDLFTRFILTFLQDNIRETEYLSGFRASDFVKKFWSAQFCGDNQVSYTDGKLIVSSFMPGIQKFEKRSRRVINLAEKMKKNTVFSKSNQVNSEMGCKLLVTNIYWFTIKWLSWVFS